MAAYPGRGRDGKVFIAKQVLWPDGLGREPAGDDTK